MRGVFTALIVAGALFPASALGGGIPGAHYTGTTDQNYPIGFDVSADGNSITNVVTTVNGSCGLSYSTNSQFLFPITGDTISGDDPDQVPYLKMRGTFTTPQRASGTLDAFNGTGGSPLFCNALGREWTARTSASPDGGDPDGGDPVGGDPGEGDPGGGDPGGGDPGGALGAPSVTILFPNGVKLKPSLSNGVVVTVQVDQASTLVGKLTLSAKNARKYGLGKRARVISTDRAPRAGTDTLLEFTFAKKVARKLKKAKKLSLRLDVTARRSDGVVGRASRTLKFS